MSTKDIEVIIIKDRPLHQAVAETVAEHARNLMLGGWPVGIAFWAATSRQIFCLCPPENQAEEFAHETFVAVIQRAAYKAIIDTLRERFSLDNIKAAYAREEKFREEFRNLER